MHKIFIFVALTMLSSVSFAQSILDSEIKKQMIEESVSSYSGNCPCPYFTDRAGRSCGKRSAYSKPGGYDPLCYERDISDDMVKSYRRLHNL